MVGADGFKAYAPTFALKFRKTGADSCFLSAFSTGNLSFLNEWTYPLGLEILTPFGREQLFNLGVSFRTKYGALLKAGQKPVFRTESQDRMVKSALNFAAGFFGGESCARVYHPSRRAQLTRIIRSTVSGAIPSAHHRRSAKFQQHACALHDLPERWKQSAHRRPHEAPELGQQIFARCASADPSASRGRRPHAGAPL